MKKTNEIDYSKLLGFAAVRDRVSGSIDFQDDAMAAKLGAKVGLDPSPPMESAAPAQE